MTEPVENPTLRPDMAVIGVERAGGGMRLLHALGFETIATFNLTAADVTSLFGITTATSCHLVGIRGSASGRILAVETPLPPARETGLKARAVAVDVFTRRLSDVVTLGQESGAQLNGTAEYTREDGKHFAMARLITSDGVPLVVIEPTVPRPSILDLAPDLLVSEVTATMSIVADIEAVRRVWTGDTGLDVVLEYTRSERQVGEMLELPRTDTPHHIALLAPRDEPTFRFEVVELPEETVENAWNIARPLSQGAVITGFRAPDIIGALRRLGSASAPVDAPIGMIASGVATDGTPFFLHQDRDSDRVAN